MAEASVEKAQVQPSRNQWTFNFSETCAAYLHKIPHIYKRDGVWLTMFQVDESQNPLRTVLQNLENDLLRSLQANRYHYGAEMMNAASPTSEKFGADNADSRLEPREKGSLL